MFHCAIKGPIFRFPHQIIYPQFPHCVIKGFKFPHCIIKGPRILHGAIKGPQFLHHVIQMMSCNFSSRYQGVTIYHCVIKGYPLLPLISHHVIKVSQFIIALSRRSHFPHRVIKGIQISKINQVYNFMRYVLFKKSRI